MLPLHFHIFHIRVHLDKSTIVYLLTFLRNIALILTHVDK